MAKEITKAKREAIASRIVAEIILGELAGLDLRERQPFEPDKPAFDGVMESDKDYLSDGDNMEAACKLLSLFMRGSLAAKEPS